MVRFNVDGSIDSSFGNNGTSITDFGFLDYTNSVLLQSNGKIIASGESDDYITPSYDASLARYNNDELTKKQIIVQKIRHYIQTHNAQATTLNDVSVYPNPAQNVLHVVGLSANAKLTVVDFSGNIVVSSELRAVSGGYDLNIASLHAGNYLLKIETNGEVVMKQFVKE